ncbi:Uncharacterised protein [uncultured archaeon]|nr:Uncharacterised protein [uncultured archaeon]
MTKSIVVTARGRKIDMDALKHSQKKIVPLRIKKQDKEKKVNKATVIPVKHERKTSGTTPGKIPEDSFFKVKDYKLVVVKAKKPIVVKEVVKSVVHPAKSAKKEN